MNNSAGRLLRAATVRLTIGLTAVAVVCAYSTTSVKPVARVENIENTAAIVASPTTIGIADSSLYGMSTADIDTTLNTLQSIGVQDIRVYVPWAYVEPLDGSYNWTQLDTIMQAAAARNMGVVAEINSTPLWAAPSGTLPGAGEPSPSDFATFATQVATRYGNEISAYEIWNEPNYVGFSEPIDPAGYAALLKAAYPAIKAVDPSATVIAGALGSVVSFGGLTLDPVTFVNDMYAAGAKGYFDALSFHPYNETLEFSQGANIANAPLNQLNAIEAVMAANGDASKLIWITEYGLPTSDVSQQTQADYISNLLNTWQTISYAGPVFIYTAQDGQPGAGTYGIYEADWTPKLAVSVIQQAIAAANPLAALARQILAAIAAAITSWLNALAGGSTASTAAAVSATTTSQTTATAAAAVAKSSVSLTTTTMTMTTKTTAATTAAATTTTTTTTPATASATAPASTPVTAAASPTTGTVNSTGSTSQAATAVTTSSGAAAASGSPAATGATKDGDATTTSNTAKSAVPKSDPAGQRQHADGHSGASPSGKSKAGIASGPSASATAAK